MDEIKELQDIWKLQHSTSKSDMVYESIQPILQYTQKLEDKNKRLNLFKSVAVLILLVPIFGVLPETGSTKLTYLGIGIIIISVLIMIILNHHLRFRLRKTDMAKPQFEFLKTIHDDMKRFSVNFKRLFVGFIICMISGINLVYFDLFGDSPVSFRLGLHSGFSAFMCIAAWLGYFIRSKRTKKEFAPIREMLDTTDNL